MKTASQLTPAIEAVSPEAIGRAHKCFEGNKAFYMVANSQEKVNDAGEIIEYKVTHDKNGFHCTCKSGQVGFSNCKIGVCSHVLISLAAAREEKEAVKELQAQIAVQAAMSDEATVKAAQVAAEAPVKAARKSSAKPYSPKPFSLMR